MIKVQWWLLRMRRAGAQFLRERVGSGVNIITFQPVPCLATRRSSLITSLKRLRFAGLLSFSAGPGIDKMFALTLITNPIALKMQLLLREILHSNLSFIFFSFQHK